MKIVAPLCVHAISALIAALHDARIIQIALSNQYQVPPEFLTERLYFFTELSEKVPGTVVHQRMDRIQPQTVEVIVPEPHESVVDEEPAYLITAPIVEI